MKKLFVLLLLFATSLPLCAQFKLSGQIINRQKEDLNINIPLVFGFHKENSIHISIRKDGRFSLILPLNHQKFANLIFQRQFFTLLLSPGKDLVVSLSPPDSSLKLISGSALAENKVMQSINLEEYPFFMKNEGGKYAKYSFQLLNAEVLKPYFKQMSKKVEQVNSSSLSEGDKQLISSELKYISYNYLNDLARTQTLNNMAKDSLILGIFDPVHQEPQVSPAGPQYYAFVDNYVRFLETKAFIRIKVEMIPPGQPIPYFGISLDSANVIVKKYGKAYWHWLGTKNNFSGKVVENYNYQKIVNLYEEKDLRVLAALAKAFEDYFPNSLYLNDIQKKVDLLKARLKQNETNESINIVRNFENLNSIYDVVKDFKGKVLYLDVWGTWCPPCKDELRYNPQLKSEFKGKDVVFLYLDMDEDDMDANWREFIKVNELTGSHLRKSRKTIGPFWKELLANHADKAEYYPQYFIFDRQGKLAVAKALRPSDEKELYNQIYKILDKKK